MNLLHLLINLNQCQMKQLRFLFILIFSVFVLIGCRDKSASSDTSKYVRTLKDTIGFAQYPWQMDSIMDRIDKKGWDRVYLWFQIKF